MKDGEGGGCDGDQSFDPPEELRCCRSDGESWRCNNWRIQGMYFCQEHYLKVLKKSRCREIIGKKKNLKSETDQTSPWKKREGKEFNHSNEEDVDKDCHNEGSLEKKNKGNPEKDMVLDADGEEEEEEEETIVKKENVKSETDQTSPSKNREGIFFDDSDNDDDVDKDCHNECSLEKKNKGNPQKVIVVDDNDGEEEEEEESLIELQLRKSKEKKKDENGLDEKLRERVVMVNPTFVVKAPKKEPSSGRPKTSKISDEFEAPKQTNKATNNCSTCGATGHNKEECNGPEGTNHRITKSHAMGRGRARIDPNNTNQASISQSTQSGGKGKSEVRHNNMDSMSQPQQMEGMGRGTGQVRATNMNPGDSSSQPIQAPPTLVASLNEQYMRESAEAAAVAAVDPNNTNQASISQSTQGRDKGKSEFRHNNMNSMSQPQQMEGMGRGTGQVRATNMNPGDSSSQPIQAPPALVASLNEQYMRESAEAAAVAAVAATRRNFQQVYGFQPDCISPPRGPINQVWRPHGREPTKFQPQRPRMDPGSS